MCNATQTHGFFEFGHNRKEKKYEEKQQQQ